MKEQRAAGYLIAKIHQISGRIFAKKLRKYNISDINPAQGRIMFALWKKDGVSIVELGKETGLSKSTLTSMLDRLEQAGFIRRVPSKKDRREILIQLADKDKLLQNKYVDVSQDMTKIFYNNFTEQEINDFENYLAKLLDNLIKFEKKDK